MGSSGQGRTPLASHFADEGDETPSKMELEQREEKVKKKVARKGKSTGGKKTETAVESEPLVRPTDVPVDETDKKKATADLRDLQLLEPSDASQSWELSFGRAVTDDVSAAFAKMLGFARQLNAGVVPVAEFVLVGFAGSGKSSLIEVLLGQPFNLVGVGSTKRSVFFQWVNNRTVKSLRVTVKRDPSKADFDRDVEVPLAGLETELARRMGVESDNPVFVTFESADTLNFTVIDTLGLGQSGQQDAQVLAMATPPHRQIIAVQRATPEPDNPVLAYLADIDPSLARTTLVYSSMFDALKQVQDPDALGRFFARTPENAHKFFTSMPFFAQRSSLTSRAEYCEIVFKMHHRDLQALEKLQFDKRLTERVGALALRSWINSAVSRNFQRFIPSLLQTSRERLLASQEDLRTVREQMDSFKGTKLRSLASNYATEFLQCVASLLSGTAEGNAVISGETLEEEKKGSGDGAWRTSTNLPIVFKGELEVPLASSKLYGGQQLERLLAEFLVVAARSEIPEPSLADVANAAGVNKLSNSTDITWSAADLAQHKSRDAFVPLIRQLGARSAYIMKRLGEISRRMMENRRRPQAWGAEAAGETLLENVDDATKYVSFRHFVRDAFDRFVDQQTQVLVQKCMDEFYSTRTVHYSCSEEAAALVGEVDVAQPDELKRAVVAMSKHIFGKLRQRITKNTLLKVYNFLLVPMQGALWTSLQAAVASLSDADLQKKFEVTSTIQRLQNTERSVLERIETTKSLTVDVQRAAASFTGAI